MDIFYTIIKYLASPLENGLILYFLIRNFGVKKNNICLKISTVAVFGIAVILAQLTVVVPNGDIIFPIVMIIAFWGYSLMFLKGKRLMQLLSCFTIMIIMVLTSTLAYQILSITMRLEVAVLINDDEVLTLWIFILSKVMLVIGIEVLLYIFKRNELHLRKKEWITLMITIGVSIVICTVVYILSLDVQSDQTSSFYFMIILIGIFILNIYVYHSILKISMDNQQILKTKLADLQRQEMANQLLQISEASSNEERMRHDYKNHLLCMQALLNSGQYNDVKDYIQRITKNYTTDMITSRVCNNAVINSVVSNKISICKEKNIEWEHHVTGDTSKMDGVACSIILFNLLDNAIEASENLENGKILLSMYYNKNYFHIEVKNTIGESVLENNPKLHSSKRTGNHGLGHINVREVVNKNGGIVDYYEDGNNFIAHVMLKL